MKKIYALTAGEVLHALITSEQGLAEDDARRRLHEYGFNEIQEVRRTPLYRRLLSQFTHFLAVLLWIAAGLSLLSEYLRPGGGMLFLGLAIIGVIVVNAVFTFIQEYRAERAVQELEKLLPYTVRVVRKGVLKDIPAREVVPGDLILLKEGDRVPADARLIRSIRLSVNNAPLTGESELKPRSHEPFDGDYFESPNIVFAGTLVVAGSGTAAVFATGMATEFGKIAHLTSSVEPELSPLQREIARVTRIVAVIALTTGIVFFGVGLLTGKSFWQTLLFAVGITIANVPEGLLPTVTLSLAMGSQRMAKRRALVKNLTSVETLGSVTVICTDKTGTITQNRMEARRVWLPGIGFLDAGAKEWNRSTERMDMLMTTSLLCNNARYENGAYHGDPTETALLKAAHAWDAALAAKRIYEIPFDAERKRMTTVNSFRGTPYVFMKGAVETVLPLCTALKVNSTVSALDERQRAALLDASAALMEEGLRVIAFAYRRRDDFVPERLGSLPDAQLESEMIFAGLIGLEDPPRPEVFKAIETCRTAGIRVIMITGDASRTAAAIARRTGIAGEHPLVIEGPTMSSLTDEKLGEMLGSGDVIFSRMTPHHKMRIVSALMDRGERVAVTGDGVNDAPALKKADIGIAMGITGTDVAREAADVVLLDDNFATIVNAIEEGRAVFENIKKFINYIFASNIPEIVPYIAYVLFRIPLPLTIIQILAIDLGTDMFPALALGAERPSPEIMKQPPRGRRERLVNFDLLGRAYLFLGPIEAFAGLYGFFFVLDAGGWQWGETLSPHTLLYLEATTACFAGIVITQVANVFACRTFRESVFTIGLLSNRLIVIGIVLEIAITVFIIYTPWGNALFGTAPLGPHVWLTLLPFSVLLLAAEEGRKLLVRKFAV
ncbi:MAG: cation-transporting P-type ATPase [Nitrospirota bacterium]